MKMYARLVTLALTFSGVGLNAVGQTVALRPEWTLRSAGQRIDWVERLDERRGGLLIAADVDGRVCLLSAATGRVGGDWIATEPGVRFAGGAGGVAFVLGVQAVYAISATADNRFRLAWKLTVSNPLGTPTDGDPEYLLRIVAARATRRGVLIVRSDGVAAELASSNGGARWRSRLEPLASGTLHVLGDAAAFVWSGAGVARAAFFDLRGDRPMPRVVELGSSLPIWSALARIGPAQSRELNVGSAADDSRRKTAQRELRPPRVLRPPGARRNSSKTALVAVWVDRLRVIPFDQGDEPCGSRVDGPVSAAALGIDQSSDPKQANALYAARSGEVSAFDLHNCHVSGTPLARAAEPPVSLELAGGYVIIRARGAAEFFHAGSRDKITRIAGPGRIVSATVIAGSACLVATDDLTTVRDEGECTFLTRSLATDARGLAAYALSESRSPRQVLWLAARVVIVDAAAARSYTLPRARVRGISKE